MPEAAVAESSSMLDPARLAAQHGLRVAGARPSLFAYSRKLWSYRHFIVAFANAKHVATFSKARLGSLWQVLTPLTNAAVYFLIFGFMLNTRDGIGNFIAFLCTGVFLFGYTQQVVLSGVRSIPDNLALIRALHFPRASLPIAATLTQLQQMAASVVVLLAIVVVSGEPVTMRWPLLLPVLVLQSIFNAGLALTMARFGSKLTDLKQLMPFVMRTWMYASGVFYSIAKFTADLPHGVALAIRSNPLLVYIELAHSALLKNPPPAGMSPGQLWFLAVAWALLFGIGGYLFFWLGEQEYGRG